MWEGQTSNLSQVSHKKNIILPELVSYSIVSLTNIGIWKDGCLEILQVKLKGEVAVILMGNISFSNEFKDQLFKIQFMPALECLMLC